MSLRSVYNWWLHGNGHSPVPPVWYAFFAAVTLVCHFLAPLIFKIETVEVKPVWQRPRSNKAINMRNPNFRKFCSSLPPESDPTVFIHGSRNLGYSRFLTLSEQEELDAASSVRPVLSAENQGDSAEHPGGIAEIDPGERPQLFTGLLAEKMTVAGNTPAVPANYPVWADSRGTIPGLKKPQAEDQLKKQFISHDVIGPTALEVILRSNSVFPPTSRIIRSSGSMTLDFYAKRELDKFLEKQKNAARFDRRNNVVRVYWNKNAPVLHDDSGMAMFFAGEENK